jgi:GAF domain-containing protein
VIAYLGVPLITAEGQAIGTLCVIDHEPRIWTKDEISLVTDIAAAVVTEITLRTTQRNHRRKRKTSIEPNTVH